KLKAAMAWIGQADPADRPKVGQGLNALKKKLTEGFEQKKKQLGAAAKPQGPAVDVTEPGTGPRMGRDHVLSRVLFELVEVFGRMGFDSVEGPEIEDEHHNFVALNIPQQHPARDPLDNFYLDENHLLRTQTSTIQIRVMESTKPPLRIVAPGRVYRPDTHDATHSSMFHQIEGLYVDREVSMVDLKTTLMQFAHAYFGPEAEVRLRPSYFPFTEPSAELDIKMKLKDGWDWVELGGCGMVDPAVFEAVGYDPEVWSGFAFGLGVERIAMRRYGVADIRWLYENDIRFLRQF
ncbi:MAG: phenylalanine--tRNA ligase subunit alpha, partial [Phycisphaeraceae bacterium]|nr:phenylalanine--tRNA ligase subunit alpha [Phycisphaeraceae bacterium]